MYVLLFANGDLHEGEAVHAALEGYQTTPPDRRLAVVADGGLRHALHLGVQPDIVVGDLDSADPQRLAEVAAKGAEVRRSPAAKDETDLELALLAALEKGGTTLRLIGALGGRLDQTLGNLQLLTLPALQGRDVRIVNGRETTWVAHPGSTSLSGAAGDTISLIPLTTSVEGIYTQGLHYPLQGEALRVGPSRGVSNVMTAAAAEVRFASGLLLIVHTTGRA